MARELSQICGILEPLQTASFIDGQIKELKAILEKHGNLPITLIGHSWGAWLSFMLAAKHPALVKKLILVGSGPFQDKYVPVMIETRSSLLTEEEQRQIKAMTEALSDPGFENKQELFKKFGRIMAKVDSFCPISLESEVIEFQPDIFQSVMEEAAYLRKCGQLLAMGNKIECPVIALHGVYDPHPFQGVQEPLSQVVKIFRFVLLQECGHNPWNELHAKDKFYEILKKELGQ